MTHYKTSSYYLNYTGFAGQASITQLVLCHNSQVSTHPSVLECCSWKTVVEGMSDPCPYFLVIYASVLWVACDTNQPWQSRHDYSSSVCLHITDTV